MNNLNFTTITVIDSSGKKNILENIGDPNSVEWVCIENTRYGFSFLLNKNALKEKLNHSASVERAKEIHPAGRLGDRFEWISVYNAIHTAGLNDILERIGGDTIDCSWYWTEEQDEFASYACSAWVFYGSPGNLGCNISRLGAYYARVFRAL